MAKFSLTAAGVEAFTAHLYAFSNDKLKAEAILLAEDPRAYLMAHFEMPVHQLEFLRALSDSFMIILGWSFSLAIVSRRPISYSIMKNITTDRCEDTCILVSSNLTHHFDEGTVSSIGKLVVQV